MSSKSSSIWRISASVCFGSSGILGHGTAWRTIPANAATLDFAMTELMGTVRCGGGDKTLRLVLVAWRPRPNSGQGGVASPYAFFDTPTIDPGSYHPTDMSTLWLALFDHLEISVGLGSFILAAPSSVWPTTASTMSGMMTPDEDGGAQRPYVKSLAKICLPCIWSSWRG